MGFESRQSSSRAHACNRSPLLCVKLPEWREGLGRRNWRGRGVGEEMLRDLNVKRRFERHSDRRQGSKRSDNLWMSPVPLSHLCHPLLLTPASSEEQGTL